MIDEMKKGYYFWKYVALLSSWEWEGRKEGGGCWGVISLEIYWYVGKLPQYVRKKLKRKSLKFVFLKFNWLRFTITLKQLNNFLQNK